ncbi:MAG: hypothetical protein JWR23_2614 [Mucilaginibacter sp.]|nr:hypothetical protein [Mucilaginibacter sp.]
MFSFINQPSPNSVTHKLLKKLSKTINPELIDTELENHLDYLSMSAMSDILRALEI